MNTEQLSPQIIGRANLERVSNFHAREVFAALLGEVAPTDLAAVVAGLERHFACRERGALLECTACGGWSDDTVSTCAFCGEQDVETREVATHPLAPVEVEPAQPKAVALATKAVRKKLASPRVQSLDWESRVETKVQEFEKCRYRAVAGYTDACRTAFELRGLYAEGAKEDTFAAFAERRLGLKRSQVFAMITVHEKGLAPVAARFGIEVAKAIASAEEEDRPRLLGLAEDGGSSRDVATEARRLVMRKRFPQSARVEGGSAVSMQIPQFGEVAFRRADDMSPLTSIDDLPAVARIAGTNGEIWLSLRRNDAGALELSVCPTAS